MHRCAYHSLHFPHIPILDTSDVKRPLCAFFLNKRMNVRLELSSLRL